MNRTESIQYEGKQTIMRSDQLRFPAHTLARISTTREDLSYSPVPAYGAVVLFAEDPHSGGAGVTDGMIAAAGRVNFDGIATQVANHVGRGHPKSQQ